MRLLIALLFTSLPAWGANPLPELPPSQLQTAVMALEALQADPTQSAVVPKDLIASCARALADPKFDKFLASLNPRDLDRIKGSIHKIRTFKEVHPSTYGTPGSFRFAVGLGFAWTLHIYFQGNYSLETGNPVEQAHWLKLSRDSDMIFPLLLATTAIKDAQVFKAEIGPHRDFIRNEKAVTEYLEQLEKKIDRISATAGAAQAAKPELGLFDDIDKFVGEEGERLAHEIAKVEGLEQKKDDDLPALQRIFQKLSLPLQIHGAKKSLDTTVRDRRHEMTFLEEAELIAKLNQRRARLVSDKEQKSTAAIAAEEKRLVEEIALWFDQDHSRRPEDLIRAMGEYERELRQALKRGHNMPKFMAWFFAVSAFTYANAGAFTNIGKKVSPLDWVIPGININVDDLLIRNLWIGMHGYQVASGVALAFIAKVYYDHFKQRYFTKKADSTHTKQKPKISLYASRSFWNENRRLVAMASRLSVQMRADPAVAVNTRAKHSEIPDDPIALFDAFAVRMSTSGLCKFYERALRLKN